MSQIRPFLLIAWVFVAYLLWDAWQKDSQPLPSPAAGTDVPAQAIAGDAAVPGAADIPSVGAAPVAADVPSALPASTAAAPTEALIDIRTDVLRVQIDAGASLRRAELLAYGTEADDDAPRVALLTQEPGRAFTAQSGFISSTGVAPSHQSQYASPQSSYSLADGAERLEVPMTWTDPSGLSVTRTFVFQRGSYVIEVRDSVSNAGDAPWSGSTYRQLLREPPPPPKGGTFTNPEAYSFVGAAWYSPEEKFEKRTFDDFADEPALDRQITGGWTAMLQHYFFAAWIPAADEVNRFATATLPGGSGPQYLIRQVGPAFEVAPGATVERSARLYVGPKLQNEMAEVAPGLELAIDYGVLTLLAKPLFWLLDLLHGVLGNWGWAIIGLVVLIKLLFFKLSEAQYKSFARMRAVQPRIESLKERYGDDKQKFQMAMMELYKKEKINPLGGCLPILVQIPVFISLYWVLLESVELRHAPWMLWIDNLTARDPYFVLPVLNMATMYLTQLMTPTPGMDPVQKKMMQAMPLVFGVLFAFFPAGLVLYWTTNGVLGLLQQWIITKRHGGPAKA